LPDAAHLAGGNRHAPDLGERRTEGRSGKQLLLDAPADLELLAHALLGEELLLVASQVAGHLVEGLGQAGELHRAGHGNGHVQVPAAQPLRARGQGAEVPGHAPREREDAEKGESGQAEAQAQVARGRAADLLQGLSEGPGHPDHDAGVGVRLQSHHPVGGIAPRGRLPRDQPEPGEHGFVHRVRCEELPLGVLGEGDGPFPPLGSREDRPEQGP
jgi:hypothetical protein